MNNSFRIEIKFFYKINQNKTSGKFRDKKIKLE